MNDFSSHSGWSALIQTVDVAREDIDDAFAAIYRTASHSSSIDAVVRGQCDGAAIDAVTLDLLQHHRPSQCRDLRVIGWSPEAMAPPFVVPRRSELLGGMHEAITVALEEAGTDVCDLLGFRAVQSVSMNDYAEIERLARRSPAPRRWTDLTLAAGTDL